MRYLFCFTNQKQNFCGISISTCSKISILLTTLFQLSLLISLLFMKVGIGAYFLSTIKLVILIGYAIGLYKEKENLVYYGHLVLQIFIFIQITFVVLFFAMIFTIFKYAPANVITGLVFYFLLLSVQ